MSDAPHLVTLTGNLLAERTLEFEAWSPGKTQRARAESFQVGGKGINVSKMLNRLHAPNTAVCFTGGAPGAECEAWLGGRGFAFRAFATSRPTRTGTVVRSPGQAETTFLGVDTPPDAAALRACVEFLEAQPPGTVLAVCGSLPGWATPEFDALRDVLHRWPEHGSLVVDTHGAPLAWFAREAVAFIRVNRSEILSLFATDEQKLGTDELLALARQRLRVANWAISDGAAPVWLVTDSTEPERIATPHVTEVSPTGSGDVMFACALHGRFHRGLSWRDAVVAALPYAAANAAHAGVAEFPLPLG
jgi:fructose-1-phosphate kinase PfkB-like protein